MGEHLKQLQYADTRWSAWKDPDILLRSAMLELVDEVKRLREEVWRLTPDAFADKPGPEA
jgi:hypothetical protein